MCRWEGSTKCCAMPTGWAYRRGSCRALQHCRITSNFIRYIFSSSTSPRALSSRPTYGTSSPRDPTAEENGDGWFPFSRGRPSRDNTVGSLRRGFPGKCAPLTVITCVRARVYAHIRGSRSASEHNLTRYVGVVLTCLAQPQIEP